MKRWIESGDMSKINNKNQRLNRRDINRHIYHHPSNLHPSSHPAKTPHAGQNRCKVSKQNPIKLSKNMLLRDPR